MCEAASSYYCNLDYIQMEKAANVYSRDRLKWKLALYMAELAFWAWLAHSCGCCFVDIKVNQATFVLIGQAETLIELEGFTLSVPV